MLVTTQRPSSESILHATAEAVRPSDVEQRPTGSLLYICYQSVLEPLTETQVIAYLEGLALAGHRVALLTFEPRRLSSAEADACRQSLLDRGIRWHWRRYHKRPTVPATMWDTLVGVVTGLWLVRKYRIDVVHARAHVPGLMAWILKRLTGAKMLFDIRGLMAEEYVDAGVWPAGGRLFRITKRVERRLVAAADALVVLTQPAARLLRQWYPDETRGKPLVVIPCCVDYRQLLDEPASVPADRSDPVIVYIGKLGGWYLTETMVEFVSAAMQTLPQLRWDVWTQSDPATLRALVAAKGIAARVSIGRVPAHEIPHKLRGAAAGLSLIKPCVSKLASSPTKVGEYLAAGVPVISTRGIGDLDELLETGGYDGAPVGALIDLDSNDGHRAAVERFLELIRDPTVSQRCRSAAREQLDLERIGWRRYRDLYQHILLPGNAS
ncbi:MAG TPA: glycosyltransferase [Pirellulales bacterium]|nr:glycosyltransferase [Pirellulales bacterium]